MTPIADLSVHYDSNNDQVCETVLTGIFSLQYERAMNQVGSFSFSLMSDDSAVAHLDIGVRIAITHNASDIVLFSGRIVSWEQTEVGSGEESEMIIAYSGSDDLGSLQNSLVRPWQTYGNGDTNAMTRRPTSPTRNIGWMDPTYGTVITNPSTSTPTVPAYRSPGYDQTTWRHATALYRASARPPAASRPWWNAEGFPDPYDAYWIWSEAVNGSTGSHPLGDVYFYRYFLVPSSVNGLVFYMAGDNEYEVWFNGQFLAESSANDSGDAFRRTKRVIVNKTGTEIGLFGTILVKVRNTSQNASDHSEYLNPGGFLMSVRALGQFTPLLVTDSTWSCTGYPINAPGWPVGFVFSTLRTEGQIRNLVHLDKSVFEWSTFDFTDTSDSAGNPWPLVTDLPISDGSSIWSVMENLSDRVEFDYLPQKAVPKYRGWGKDGVTLIGGGTGVGKGSTKAVTISRGVNATDIHKKVSTTSGSSSETFANVLVYRWKNGVAEVRNGSSIATYGRYEAFLSMGDRTDVNEVADIAQRKLDIMSAIPTSYTATVDLGSGIVPGVSFDTGDWITIQPEGPTGPSIQERVVSMSGSMDEDGIFDCSIELGTRRDVLEFRYEQWLAKSAPGLEFSSGSRTQPESFESTDVDMNRLSHSSGDGTATDASSGEVTVDFACRIGLISLGATAAGSTSTVMQLYVNGVAKETITLPGGSVQAYYMPTSGTVLKAGDKVKHAITTWGTNVKSPAGTIDLLEIV